MFVINWVQISSSSTKCSMVSVCYLEFVGGSHGTTHQGLFMEAIPSENVIRNGTAVIQYNIN